MKTAEEWLPLLSESSFGHRPDCICERCKNGCEIFLIPSDIRAIQIDALEHAVEVAMKAMYSPHIKDALKAEIQKLKEKESGRNEQ